LKSMLIRNGRVVDPAQGIDAPRDILIRDGRVAGVEPRIEVSETEVPAAQVVDATGLVVAPGLVDLHVHLREPGFEHKETLETGARAAVAGGFTSICYLSDWRDHRWLAG